ncbi:MAG: AI-2E family transporter [Clostridia bacterium]|nr:AI-2E family transporter [Clostridia bacterium]
MNNRNFKREYVFKGITAFLVIAASILFAFLVFNIRDVWSFIKRIISVFNPVIFGLVIAYLVNPMVNFFDGNIYKLTARAFKKPESAKKTSYFTSVILGMLIFVFLIVGFFWMIIPQFISSMGSFIDALPEKIDAFSAWGDNFLKENEYLKGAFTGMIDYERNWLTNDVSSFVGYIATGAWSVAWGALNFVKEFALGIIFAIYILLNRDRLIKHCKKALYAFLSDKTVGRILSWTSKSHKVFSGFINGKLLDSLIIFVLCFIGTAALGIPYAVIVSVIVGITNFIPVFGPYIGGIPSAILVTIADPLKGLYFIIFIILLQTLDGNVIGPKILGDKTGLSTFWVMVAIVVGGGLFGVIGMLVGVPAFAVIYYAFTLLVNFRLKQKNKPTDSNAYSREALEAAENNVGEDGEDA